MAGVDLTSSVVIATWNRPEPLRECLLSLAGQTLLPCEVILVDASDDGSTGEMSQALQGALPFPLLYLRATIRSSAVQRNQGAERAKGELIFFLDDDVVLEKDYLAEIVRVFEQDTSGQIGGVSGTIINQTYNAPSWLNRWLLQLCVGKMSGSYAGRLVGPAVNFLPEDGPDRIRRVEWLNTTGTAYRREVFLRYRFAETFLGYSAMEDVHLSARVAKQYTLLNTSNARLYHKDLGSQTHQDWVTLGENLVFNRHAVMVGVLGRTTLADYLRFFAYEMVYGVVTSMARGSRQRSWPRRQVWRGKLRGFWKILTGQSPHHTSHPPRPK